MHSPLSAVLKTRRGHFEAALLIASRQREAHTSQVGVIVRADVPYLGLLAGVIIGGEEVVETTT